VSDCIVEDIDGVRVIRFNRPERMNSLGGTLLQEFNEALVEGRTNDRVRAFLVTGEGRGWCAGADLQAVGGRGGGTPASQDAVPRKRAAALDPIGYVGEAVLNIFNCDKPTIAAINGATAGGGFGLASAFDIRIASEQARFTTVFIKRALAPDCGLSWFLPRLVGAQRAAEMFYSGRMVDAEEALQIGLVERVVPHDQLMEEGMKMARLYAKQPPFALTYTLRALHGAMTNTLEEQLRLEWTNQRACLGADEFKEGVQAFLEKREPNFA
jgi:2-(1,2-epoxy-1,2-dihydrophenyl)acetyl-CoA isomerase